jgi:hypothetical protein
MPAPQVPKTVALEGVRDDLVFSYDITRAHPAAADVAPRFKALIDAWPAVYMQQLAHWDAQTAADARIAMADIRLDALVDRFWPALLALVGQDRNDPHFRLYFTVPPNELKRPVLGPQLDTIKGWLVHFAKESDPTLVELGKEFKAAVKQANEALTARRNADADNEHFRAKGELAAYLDEVRKERDAVYADLDGRPAKDASLPRDFASMFFRHRKPPAPTDGEKKARADKRAAEKAAAEAKKKAVSDAKAKVKEAQKALRELSR